MTVCCQLDLSVETEVDVDVVTSKLPINVIDQEQVAKSV